MRTSENGGKRWYLGIWRHSEALKGERFFALLSSRSWVRLPLDSIPKQAILSGWCSCVRVGKRAKDIGWKEFFAFYWKSTFCFTAGAVGSFPTFRLFCQHRCSGKRAICLTLAYAPCQQFSTLHIFTHCSARFHVFGATKSTIFLSKYTAFRST